MRAAEAGLWLLLGKSNTRKIGLPGRFAGVKGEARGLGTQSKALGQLDPTQNKVIEESTRITAGYFRAYAKDFQAFCPAA